MPLECCSLLCGNFVTTANWFSIFVKHRRSGLCILVVCCSVAQSYPTLCDPMNCSTPGLSVLHYLLESAQTHVH